MYAGICAIYDCIHLKKNSSIHYKKQTTTTINRELWTVNGEYGCVYVVRKVIYWPLILCILCLRKQNYTQFHINNDSRTKCNQR